MPPADILLAMRKLFNVSVNELLTRRRLTEKEYKEEAKNNLASTLRQSKFSLQERILFFKNKWLKEHIFKMVITILLFGLLFVLKRIKL